MAICSTGLQAQTRSGAGAIAAEATIFENQAGNNGGGYTSVCVGNLSTTGTTRRGYVRYTLPDIPPGSTITRVRLRFTQVRVRFMGNGSPKTATLQLRRVASNWTEGSGVAENAACGGGANVNGIDWTGAPGTSGPDSGTEALPSADAVTITFDTDVGNDDDGLIGDVQAWLDSGAGNFGWRMRIAEEGTVDNTRLINPGSLTVFWTENEVEPVFKINAGLNDAWFNQATAGQGFFFTVFPDLGLFFLAWFTFETERPDEDVIAILGEAGHRWVTAIGEFGPGNTVTLSVELTEGGVFDSEEPMPVQTPDYGTITITFIDCNKAILMYDFPTLGLSGTIELTRVAPDNVALCLALMAQ